MVLCPPRLHQSQVGAQESEARGFPYLKGEATDGKRSMIMIYPDDLQKLRRHHNATIGLFVAFWIFALGVVGAIELLDLSEGTQDNLFGTLFGAVIIFCLLQFAKRCPNCRSNLGWQISLGIPKNCHKCGVALRE